MGIALGLGLGLPFGGNAPFEPAATLALDFTNSRYRAGAGSFYTSDFANLPNLTVTRASVGYAETVSGTLVQFGSGVARITDKGLLVEEARTNLILRSQEFDNASWGKTAATISANAATAPDGTATADGIIPNSGSVNVQVAQTAVVTSATAYTVAVYLKNGTLGNNWVELTLASTSTWRAWFNLATGAKGSSLGSPTSYNITALGNGWYRCDVTVTTGTTTLSLTVSPRPSDNSAGNVTGDGVSVANYAWQADMQAGSFITSPIPTTTASATRAADVVSIGGLSVAAPYSVLLDANYNAGLTSADMLQWGSLVSGGGIYIASSNLPTAFVREASVSTALVNSVAVTPGANFKIAARYQSNSVNASITGVLGTVDTAVTPPTLDTLAMSRSLYGFAGSYNNGYIRRAIVYPRAFSDAELQAATT